MRQTVGRAGQQLLYGGSAFQRRKHRQQPVERERGGRLRLVVQGEEMVAAEFLGRAVELGAGPNQLGARALKLNALDLDRGLSGFALLACTRQRRFETVVLRLERVQAQLIVLHAEAWQRLRRVQTAP